jgi:aflatoxin B1 aldehyde reductase
MLTQTIPLQHAMGRTYASGYLKEDIVAAIDHVIALVNKHDINGHAAALRWTVYHSKLESDLGDAIIIISASSVTQLQSGSEYIKQGPLPLEVSEAMDKIYGEIAGSEFPYHY